ncbi:DNA methyltransferase [Euryarchaeota archaeon]|nr:DNA methyltransferase [Euryarchaeota archaeon]
MKTRLPKDHSEQDWDFKGANTREYTHGFHIYPAMMIPQIARELIQRYGKSEGLLFDPYCGTGTSLVEARIAGMNALGTDLNPTARMISFAKTRDYNVKTLEKTVEQYLNSIERNMANVSDYSDFSEPEFVTWNRLEDWFPKKSIGEISLALENIDSIKSKLAQLFIRVALSECLRLVSYQRNGEFKQYRIEEKDRKNFYVALFPKLKERIERNLSGVKDFAEICTKKTKAWIKDFNTVSTSGRSNFPGSGESVDIVVTSPPYGDSGTTVAYAQFSWLSNVWLGLDNRSSSSLDNELMGGRKTQVMPRDFFKILQCKPLKLVLDKIFEQDEVRASEVMKFYYDYYLSMKNVASEVKNGGHACYVVSNRTVSGEKLPTDKFTQWAFEENGFKHIITHNRNIPNKRMPSRNSPSNVAGKTVSTMTKEQIVIMQKS